MSGPLKAQKSQNNINLFTKYLNPPYLLSIHHTLPPFKEIFFISFQFKICTTVAANEIRPPLRFLT